METNQEVSRSVTMEYFQHVCTGSVRDVKCIQDRQSERIHIVRELELGKVSTSLVELERIIELTCPPHTMIIVTNLLLTTHV